jgi:1-deoxy-D-xylulose-5-phosphate reductoisomerase
LKSHIRDTDTKVVSGINGLIDVATVKGATTTVTAVVGTIGLLPTIEAIKAGYTIALANKETLVCAGEPVIKLAHEYNAKIIPVDSEHSALLQCLNGESYKNIKKLILTASGGPFRGKTRDQLSGITPEMALRHPVWNMGKKISIDSSTLMNKGLEVIEAIHLFNIPVDSINVVIHPEGIVHSMVEFTDNSIKAQLSTPDMRQPIQYALTYPNRLSSLTKELNLTGMSALTFEEPDLDTFPCLSLAINSARKPGTACAVLNAANEAAVELFLDRKISYYGIYESVQNALECINNIDNPSIDDIITIDTQTKHFVKETATGGKN